MEKAIQTLNEKYWWDTEMRLSVLWAEVAKDQGTDETEIAGFLLEQVMGYRKK